MRESYPLSRGPDGRLQKGRTPGRHGSFRQVGCAAWWNIIPYQRTGASCLPAYCDRAWCNLFPAKSNQINQAAGHAYVAFDLTLHRNKHKINKNYFFASLVLGGGCLCSGVEYSLEMGLAKHAHLFLPCYNAKFVPVICRKKNLHK